MSETVKRELWMRLVPIIIVSGWLLGYCFTRQQVFACLLFVSVQLKGVTSFVSTGNRRQRIPLKESDNGPLSSPGQIFKYSWTTCCSLRLLSVEKRRTGECAARRLCPAAVHMERDKTQCGCLCLSSLQKEATDRIEAGINKTDSNPDCCFCHSSNTGD